LKLLNNEDLLALEECMEDGISDKKKTTTDIIQQVNEEM
jgi:hypothetical protein